MWLTCGWVFLVVLQSAVCQTSLTGDKSTAFGNDLWLGDVLSGLLGKLEKTNSKNSTVTSTTSAPQEPIVLVQATNGPPTTTEVTAAPNRTTTPISPTPQLLATTLAPPVRNGFLSQILGDIFGKLKPQETTKPPTGPTTQIYRDKSTPAPRDWQSGTLDLLKGLAQSFGSSVASTTPPEQSTLKSVSTTLELHLNRSHPPNPENAVPLVDGSRPDSLDLSKIIADFATNITSRLKKFNRTGEYQAYQTPNSHNLTPNTERKTAPVEYSTFTTASPTEPSLLAGDGSLLELLNLLAKGKTPRPTTTETPRSSTPGPTRTSLVTTLGSTASTTTSLLAVTEGRSSGLDVPLTKIEATPSPDTASKIEPVTPAQITKTFRSEMTTITSTTTTTRTQPQSITTTTTTALPSTTNQIRAKEFEKTTTTTTAKPSLDMTTTTANFVPQTTTTTAPSGNGESSVSTTPAAVATTTIPKIPSTPAWERITLSSGSAAGRLPKLRRPVPIQEDRNKIPKVIRTDPTHLPDIVTQSSIQQPSGANSLSASWVGRAIMFLNTLLILLAMNGFLT